MKDRFKDAKQFGNTLVLILPEAVSVAARHEMINEAASDHAGPILFLPHNWQAIGLDELQSMIDDIRKGAGQ